MLDLESEDDDTEPTPFLDMSRNASNNLAGQGGSGTDRIDGPISAKEDSKDSLVRRYVGELIKRVEYNNE